MHGIINEVPKISVITKIEVLRFNTTEAVDQILKDFISICIIYDLNNTVVDQTIQLCKLNKIKLPDAIIAATANVNNLTLLTRNISDFKAIPSLKIINPFNF